MPLTKGGRRGGGGGGEYNIQDQEPGRLGTGSFGPWVVSTYFGGSFRPDFF